MGRSDETKFKKPTPSRQKRLCKYWKVCGYKGEKRSFKVHFKARHPGEKIEFGDEQGPFGHGGKWSTWVEAKSRSVSASSSSSDNMDMGDTPSTITAVDGASSSQISVAGAEPHPAADAPVAGEEKKSCDGHCSACGASCRFGSDMMDVLSNIKSIACKSSADMKNLLTRCLQLLECKERVGPSEQDNQYTQNQLDRGVLFRSGRTIQNLVSATGGHLKPVEEKNLLCCTVCVEETVEISKGGKGVFTYKFSEGTDFQHVQKLPIAFKNMREHVKCHFNSDSHKHAVEARKRQLAEEEMQRKVLDSAGTRLIRTGYLVLKKSLSYIMFEHLIMLQHLNGMIMGNINHSRMFMGKIRGCFSEAVLDRLRQHTSRQPCVSVVADKVTVSRRTMNIISVTTIVPSAPADAIVQSFVVAAPVVKDHDGEGLARDLQGALSRVGVTSVEKVAALGSDGQYHHNGVGEKLKKLFIQAGDDYPTDCLPAVWDPAHLMHLADSDVRKGETPCDWVNNTIGIVSKINKRFGIGKGFEDLMESAMETDGVPALRPKVWSETRFAAYAAEVFTVFLRSGGHLKNALEKRIGGETRLGVLEDMKKELASLSSPTFMAKVMALHDIYKVLGVTSKSVQDTQSLPWERLEHQQNGVETLKKMRMALLAHLKQGRTPEELLLLSVMDELWPTLSKTKTPLQTSQVAQISFFCGKLAERLKFRNAGRDTSGSQKGTSNAAIAAKMADIRAVADLNQLATSDVPIRLASRLIVEAADRLVPAKLIPSSAVPEQRDVESVLNILRQHRGRSTRELYKIIHQQCATSQFLAIVCRLWLIFPPESIVESMANIIGEVFAENRPLDHKNAAEELLVR